MLDGGVMVSWAPGLELGTVAGTLGAPAGWGPSAPGAFREQVLADGSAKPRAEVPLDEGLARAFPCPY